jgi:hypothetical protein
VHYCCWHCQLADAGLTSLHDGLLHARSWEGFALCGRVGLRWRHLCNQAHRESAVREAVLLAASPRGNGCCACMCHCCQVRQRVRRSRLDIRLDYHRLMPPAPI